MKFQVVSSTFLNSIQNLISVNSQNFRSNSNNIKCQINDRFMLAEIVSPELTLQEVIPIKNSSNLSCISFEIDINTLFEYVNKMEEGPVTIEIETNILTIKYDQRTYSQRIHPLNERLTKREIRHDYRIVWEKLFSLKELSFAITESSYSRALEGVYLKRGENKFTAYATNGFILAKRYFEDHSFNFEEALIPKKSLSQLVKILKQGEEIFYEKTHDFLRFMTEKAFIEIRLIDLEYLNIEKLLPKKFLHEIVIDRGRFLDFTTLLNKVSKEKLSVLELLLTNGKCILSSVNNEKVVLEEQFTINTNIELKVCFNTKYLVEILKFCESDMVSISFNNSLSPFVISGSSSLVSKESILLPMRV